MREVLLIVNCLTDANYEIQKEQKRIINSVSFSCFLLNGMSDQTTLSTVWHLVIERCHFPLVPNRH